MVPLRSPHTVMRLARLGAAHPTRLSFLRVLLRRAARERWHVARRIWDMDAGGFGHAVYTVRMPGRSVSLVAFSQNLPEDQRTDRVIATAWDASFVLYDGVPDAAEIARLRANVPRQEAGRYTERDLILSRANKSVRLFDSVARTLAGSRQPDTAVVEDVGYLMRTTAVYGNGKFGIADRDRLAAHPAFAGPFQAEMLTVWLIRAFTVDLVEHCAQALAPRTAVALNPALRRRFGVGNSTGLGMAPFLSRHPLLLHRWMLAKETALARVRSLPCATAATWAGFRAALREARRNVAHWHTADAVQSARLAVLADDLARLEQQTGTMPAASPWDSLYRWAESALSLEGQEYTVTLLLEPHGALIDDLGDTLSADEDAAVPIDGTMTTAALADLVAAHCGWAESIDFAAPEALARFWYVSAEKLEPRLGERASEAGAELEQPLTFARDLAILRATLAAAPVEMRVADLLMGRPDLRATVRRAQTMARYPYAEVRDNLLGAEMRPIDLLRCKLACFGAGRFDPRSDRWLRISLFQGAPFPAELAACAAEASLGRAA